MFISTSMSSETGTSTKSRTASHYLGGKEIQHEAIEPILAK